MAIQTCRRRRYCGRECGLGRTLCLGQYHRGTELPSTRIWRCGACVPCSLASSAS